MDLDHLLVVDGVVDEVDPVVVLPEVCVDVIKYRGGTSVNLAVRDLPGLIRYNYVVLRRGIVGNLDLFKWIDTVRTGTIDRREVAINLLSEDHTTIAITWTLTRAWPVKYSFGDLNAQGTDVAVEELVIAYEDMIMS